MISFKNFLNESSEESLVTEILAQCQPFLKDVGVKNCDRIYRGIRDIGTQQPIITNKARRPKDTSITLHKSLDEAFDKSFGFKFRSESVFCTLSSNTAKDYGFPYVIFPVGDYTACWSTIVEDAWKSLDEGWYGTINDEKILKKFVPYCEEIDPSIFNQSSPHSSPTVKYEQSLDFNMERLHQCYVEYLIDHGDELLKQLGYRTSRIADYIHYCGAMTYPHELMIHCDKYFAVNTTVAKKVKEALGNSNENI